jgi:small subunit ribosomal protein S16
LVKLRLRRIGRKKAPLYKIVAADSRAPRDGRFIEAVGSYDPGVNPAKIELQEERVFHWLKNGATPTFTVKNILSRKGMMLKLHLSKKGADVSKINDEYSKWSAVQESKIQKENEKKLKRKEKKKKAAAGSETPPETPAVPVESAPAESTGS